MPSSSSTPTRRTTPAPASGPSRSPSTPPRSSSPITEPGIPAARGDRGGPFAGEATYTVSELAAELRAVLAEVYPSVWVVGEVERLRPSRRGHLYFELVEKGPGDEIVGKLDAVVWHTDHLRVARELRASGQRLAEGTRIRCRGQIDFYPAGGRVQVVVRDVDPSFTLGELERRRRETLAALAAAGLLDRNRTRPLDPVPLRIGLVTSAGSAAYHDFLSGLAESGYGFRVAVCEATMQGREAEREVARAIAVLGSLELDAVVLVRGGGARSDLQAFDSRAIAEAVARCPLPVLTGLGHEIDRSLTDLVAHTAAKTPTKVAELLVARVADAQRAVAAVAAGLAARGRERVARAGERLGRAERAARVAERGVRRTAERIADLAREMARAGRRRLTDAGRVAARAAQRLAAAGPRRLERTRPVPERAARRIADLAQGRLRERRAVVAGLARLAQELDPARPLARGYSVTRTAAGALLRRPEQVEPGAAIVTRLHGGILHSRVEEK